MMPARKPSARSYILKDDGPDFCKAAGGNRTVLAVKLSFLRAGIGHSANRLLHSILLLLL